MELDEKMTMAFLPVIGENAYRVPSIPLRHPPTRPFVTLAEDVTGIASRFLSAVRGKDEDAAKRFLSKRFLAGELTDPARLHHALDGAEQAVCARFIPAEAAKNAVLAHAEVLLDKRGVLRLHLIREPDSFGAWKIYAIERE